LKNLSELQKASEDCSKAISLDENYSNPYLLLSQIHSLLGNKEKSLELLKKSSRLGNNQAKRKLDEIGVTRTELNNTSSGSLRLKLEKCLKTTFEQHNLLEGKRISEALINEGIKDVIPYLCLSAVYGTQENWRLCEKYSLEGLKYDNKNVMLLNHTGVAMCEQGNSEGLMFLEYGKNIGDPNCNKNYNYWINRI
jgi:tetratricopeptide (TPR) repeat protein